MDVFLSCDSNHNQFIDIVIEAIDLFEKKGLSGTVRLIYPPRKIGIDTGKTRRNVETILQSELVLVNVTPELKHCVKPTQNDPGNTEPLEVYNSGVMIEYGMTVALEVLDWFAGKGKQEKRLFRDIAYSRRDLSPIVNEEDVTTYDLSTPYKIDELRNMIVEVVTDRAKSILTSKDQRTYVR